MTRLASSLIAAAVTASAAAGFSAGVLQMPKGDVRDKVEGFLVAPGEALMERLDTKRFKKLRKRVEKAADKLGEAGESAAEAVEKVGEAVGKAADSTQKAADAVGAGGQVEKLREGGEDLSAEARERLERLPHYYNVGVWSTAGFLFCFLGTLIVGIDTFGSALALGAKVTVLMLLLQGAAVFGGIIALSRMAG